MKMKYNNNQSGKKRVFKRSSINNKNRSWNKFFKIRQNIANFNINCKNNKRIFKKIVVYINQVNK